MSEQLDPTREPDSRDDQPGAQVPTNLSWHLDGIHQRRMRQLQRRATSPLNIPLWSIGLMLSIVLLAAASVALAVYTSRGNDSTPASVPVISVTNVSGLSEDSDAGRSAQATGIPTSGIQIIIAAETPANLQIDGPVLPTVDITLTPVPLSVGAGVAVAGVGDQELNIRNVPGLIDSTILFRAPEGTSFDVIDGPHQADGFTWWRIRDVDFQVEGWAVANYLQVTR